MEFVHRSYEKGKTIAAIATPKGEGGIAIIRVSGHEAFNVVNRIFSKDISKFESHTAHFGKILDHKKNVIDQVLVVLMRNPRSFTGEDTVEIQCHGGSLITQKILQRVFEEGASPALAGEFSYKAFMNGKIDLTQAEAIQEMIGAKSEASLKNAKEQLEGLLKVKISSYQKKLSDVTAIFEAWVDYPEEGLEFASYDDILLLLNSIYSDLNGLVNSYSDGKLLTHGIKLCLLGEPNAGKSSLLNALIGKERAIVTDIAGTTRDTLDVDVSFNGILFTLVDTAGIRETEEIIEQEGIKRSFAAAENSDVVLLVIDAQRGWAEKNLDLYNKLDPSKLLIVYNKIDLAELKDEPKENEVYISAKNHVGIESLKKKIVEIAFKRDDHQADHLILTKERHFQALKHASFYLYQVIEGLKKDLSPELLSMDMKECLKELGTIIGTNITEDILNAIFSKFCVGK